MYSLTGTAAELFRHFVLRAEFAARPRTFAAAATTFDFV